MATSPYIGLLRIPRSDPRQMLSQTRALDEGRRLGIRSLRLVVALSPLRQNGIYNAPVTFR